MSFVQSATLNQSLSWIQTDTQNSSRIIDSSAVTHQKLFNSGTGINQVGAVFYTTGTLNSGETRQFDLISLNRTIFGASSITNFSGGKVKIINVENLSTGDYLNLLVTGSNPFTMNFIGSSSGLTIYPSSYYMAVNISGFNITASTRYFYLKNPANSGIIYQVSLLGNTL